MSNIGDSPRGPAVWFLAHSDTVKATMTGTMGWSARTRLNSVCWYA